MVNEKTINKQNEPEVKNKLTTDNNGAAKDMIITSAIVLAVLLVISIVVRVSMKGDGTTGRGNDINVNIIHETGSSAPIENAVEEYIEYEAPDTSF